MSGTISKRLPLEKIVDLVGRLTCVAALLWLALIIAQAVSGFSTSSTISSLNELSDAGKIDTNLQNAISLDAGYWSFAKTKMSFANTHCHDSDLDSRLAEAMTVVAQPDSESTDAAQLIQFAKSSGATSQRCPNGIIWSTESDQLRLKLLVSESQPPKLIGAALATRDFQQSDGQWQLTTFKTRNHKASTLLPFDAAAKISCTRCDDLGRPQMQLVSTSLAAPSLLTLWKDNGWQIKHTAWGANDSFSFLCAKNDRVVYAWSSSDLGPRTIMLTSAHN